MAVVMDLVGCDKKEVYTRMMWLEDVATSSGIYQDDILGDLFDWGVIDELEDPDKELDVDYVAYTAANLIGEESEMVLIDDIAKSEYPDELIVAVAHDVIELDDQRAHPQKRVTEDEADIYIDRILRIINNRAFKDQNTVEFSEEITYFEDLQESEGYYPITEDLKIGTYVFDQKDEKIYEVLAKDEEGYKLKEISFDEAIEKIKIQGTINDLDLTKAQIEIDGEMIEKTSIYAQDGVDRLAGFKPSGVFEKGDLRISYSIALNKLHLHVSKKTERGINVYFDGDIYDITPSYKWDYEPRNIKEAYLKVDFKTGEEFGMSIGRYHTLYGDVSALDTNDFFNSLKDFMKPKEDLLETSFTIMKIKVPISGMPIATFDIEVKLNFYLSGKVEVALATDNALGLEIRNNHLRLIFDHDEDLDFNVNASASSTLSVIFSLHLIKDLVDLRFNGGIKALVGATVHMYDSEGYLKSTKADGQYDALKELGDKNDVFVCADISLSWILNVELNSDKTLAHTLGFGKKLTILDEDDQIFLNKSHIEKGHFVEKCTYRDRLINEIDKIEVSEDRIRLEAYSLVVRDEKKIAIKSIPNGYSSKDIRYESEDQSICLVDEEGVITPIKSGTTRVRIYTKDQKHEAFMNILVSIDENTITI